MMAASSILAAALVACSEDAPQGVTPTAERTPNSPEATAEDTPTTVANQRIPNFASSWPNTDFRTATVDLDEVRSGGVPRDGIPPLDAADATSIESSQAGNANFIPVGEADYEPQMPTIVVSIDGETKGYPIHILTWHEVANDVVGDVPVAVTFCPLCNTAIVFERTVDGERLDFGVSGMLRNSDLIMWDRQTESWWQQATGEGIAGEYAGTLLDFVAAPTLGFEDFATRHPDALVLSEHTGLGRSYGTNPYAGYDSSSRPFLFDGAVDERFPAMERVLALPGEQAIAVPYTVLSEERVANIEREAGPVAVFWTPGQASALGAAAIAEAEDVGSAVAFDPVVDGQALTFASPEPGVFVDDQTGSEWDISGRALAGPLEGTELDLVDHHVPFWFAWSAFNSEGQVWGT